MRLSAWVVVVVLLLSAGVWAGYKPVDISNIKGERRKKLIQVAKEISGFPKPAREAFLCEQLGLCFKKDGSRAMYCTYGSTKFRTLTGSWYITGSGKTAPWWGWWKHAGHMTERMWFHAFDWWTIFPSDHLLSLYPKEVEKLALNTAKYLLRNMPKEHRWMVLASIGDMLYNDKAPCEHSREDWKIDNVVPIKIIGGEGRGYFFLDPEGKEREINALVGSLVYYSVIDSKSRGRVIRPSTVGGEAGAGYWRWRWMIWRCENLVGAKDILALFPEEVEAMRARYKERIERLKDEEKAKNDALLVAADEGMSSLPKERRLARIALAMGLYYLDHREAGYADGHFNTKATIILPDGTKHSGEEFGGEAPGSLQRIPHEAIMGYYRGLLGQMAKAMAGERFKELPAPLRDLLRAQLSRKLIKFNGSPAKMNESTCAVQTFDRTWQVPVDAPVDREHTYFRNSAGRRLPYSIYNAYEKEYGQTLKLVHLCAQILGKEETVKLIPPSSGDLTAEQQRAWLAEKMGFCFAEDGGAAYQSERTANGNAVYVDAQGKMRKLAEVNGKDSAGWTDATSTALAVGYDKFTAPYKEELKQLALQTSKHILASMPSGLRQSWFAENNEFFFIPNAQISYATGERTLESGVKHPFYHGTGFDYGRSLYYDPSGKIVPTTAVGEAWDKRWWLLYYCEFVAGIDAINALFPAEVEPMRAAFQKSPFHKK